MSKIFGLFALVSLTLAGAATAEDAFRCYEDSTQAIEAGRRQYGLDIQNLRKVTDPEIIGDYDSATIVRVKVLSRNPKTRGVFRTEREFVATAFSSDVIYTIDAKKHGASVHIYMDEAEDQATVRLRGISGKLTMSCL
jgi:hypothetical protein